MRAVTYLQEMADLRRRELADYDHPPSRASFSHVIEENKD